MRLYFLACALALTALPALVVPLAAASGSTAGASPPPACKSGDPVVWINTRSKVYYTQGQSYYGKTSKGKYACRSVAVAAGAHALGATHHAASGPAHMVRSPYFMASPRANAVNPQPSMGITSPIPNMSSSPSP